MSNPSLSPAIDTGLGEQARASVAAGLTEVLASTFALALKTQNFHWNVTGPRFRSLHALFEEQYTDLFGAVDDLAERIRALDHTVPGTLTGFASQSKLEEAPDVPPAANDMVVALAKDHDAMARDVRAKISEASEAGDDGTADLLTDRLRAHEKTAWMLRSSVA